MKHLLNNLSESEKNQIRKQHTGGKKIMTEKFSKLLNSKLGDVKPINEDFYHANFGKPSVDDAAETHLKRHGYSERGRDEQDFGQKSSKSSYYIVFDGNKYYEDDIEYADYQDLGDLPRVENGKIIIANPAWRL